MEEGGAERSKAGRESLPRQSHTGFGTRDGAASSFHPSDPALRHVERRPL